MKEMRRLIYVPILHVQEDSGCVASRFADDDKFSKTTERTGADRIAVKHMGQGIAAKIADLHLPWEKTRIYQDGTPVCGNEEALAKRLAESGDQNYSCILGLIRKGASLEGTEDLELLIQEYDLLNKLLSRRAGADRDAANAEYREKSRRLGCSISHRKIEKCSCSFHGRS